MRYFQKRSFLAVAMLIICIGLIGSLTVAAQSPTTGTAKLAAPSTIVATPQETLPSFTETPIRTPFPIESPTAYFPPTFTPTSTPNVDSGQVLTVTKLEDTDDGQCDIKSCSLREAVKYASWGSIINFAPGVIGSMTLKAGINIDKKVTINGPTNAPFAITHTGDMYVFLVLPGVTATINNLTINTAHTGGGIRSVKATLTITNSTFQDNWSLNGSAVSNEEGVVTISNSTFANNQNASRPGAIFNYGKLKITNSTFQGNSGAILNFVEAVIINSTFENNASTNYSTFSGSGKYSISNSIVESATGETNCESGVPIDMGNNLQFPGKECGSTILVADPKLGPLQDNGGPTWTMDLLPESPAIDAITNKDNCPTTDQRGSLRPVDGNKDGTALCDIGAVEHSDSTLTSAKAPTFIPDPTPTIVN